MRLSKLFFKTFKEAPAEADIKSHKLLERAGYIKRLGKGLYTYSPLMWRVIKNISDIIREELTLAGAQEIHMPHLHPAELWKKTGRWEDFVQAKLLYTVEDREGSDYALGPTHEEPVVQLAHNWLTSYKQLPVNLFQITHKFRDEIRPRFGLMRAKEFLMADAYAFCKDEAQMEEQYEAMRIAYRNIFHRLGLDFAIVTADGGKIGKGKSEEFQVLADVGEDALLIAGERAWNCEAATTILAAVNPHDKPLPMQEASTAGVTDSEEQAKILKLPSNRIVKTLIYKLLFASDVKFVAIAIRSDRSINPVKVVNYFNCAEAELASEEEVRKVTGCTKGFIGALNAKVPVVVDNSCHGIVNFSCGANKEGLHFINANWSPDTTFADFLQVEVGDSCPHMKGEAYTLRRGIEVGHIFNLGTRYSEAMGASFQDEDGKLKPFYMGCYGIGVGRLAQSIIEQKGDDRGLVWPVSIAPYQVVVSAVKTDDFSMSQTAEEIYTKLVRAGIDVLLDDRNERLGFKLKDCDLLGIPFKFIVGNRTIEEGLIEVETRGGEKSYLTIDDALKVLR